MLTHRLRATTAAALAVAGLTLPATALTTAAHAAAPDCSTEQTTFTEARKAVPALLTTFREADTALTRARTVNRAGSTKATRTAVAEAITARQAAKVALDQARAAREDARTTLETCLVPPPPSLTQQYSSYTGDGWALGGAVVDLTPDTAYQIHWTGPGADGSTFDFDFPGTSDGSGTLSAYQIGMWTNCQNSDYPLSLQLVLVDPRGSEVFRSASFTSPCLPL